MHIFPQPGPHYWYSLLTWEVTFFILFLLLSIFYYFFYDLLVHMFCPVFHKKTVITLFHRYLQYRDVCVCVANERNGPLDICSHSFFPSCLLYFNWFTSVFVIWLYVCTPKILLCRMYQDHLLSITFLAVIYLVSHGTFSKTFKVCCFMNQSSGAQFQFKTWHCPPLPHREPFPKSDLKQDEYCDLKWHAPLVINKMLSYFFKYCFLKYWRNFIIN